jgi:prepilin-type N-terminal cleavage/methylation domain-containing protein
MNRNCRLPIADCRLKTRRRAMTLIEILVVMSIMVILVSAVVVAVFRVSSRGQEEGTKGLFEQIAQGLEQYKTTYQMYPPADPSDPGSLLDFTQPGQVQASSAALYQAIEYYNEFVHIAAACKLQPPGITFTDSRTGAVQPWYYYVDAWRTPLCYICQGPSYTQYTLTSGGKDLLLNTADDIVKQ